MKVLVISNWLPDKENPVKGSFISYSIEAISEWAEVFTLSIQKRGAETKDREKATSVPYTPISFPFFVKSVLCLVYLFPRIKKIAEEKKIDVIHAHSATPLSLSAALIGKILGIPVVVQCHGSELQVYPKKSFQGRVIAQLVLKNASKVIVVSKNLAKKAVELGCEKEKIILIPNGVDPKKFKPISRKTARKLSGLPKEKKIVLYVGNLIREKGVFDLADCAKKFGKEFEFWFAGFGKYDELLNKKNVFVAGPVTHGLLPYWLNSADVFVLPSYSEGMSCALLEAMACAKPVVASDIPGNREIIEDGRNGLLFKPGNIKMLGEKIAKLVENPVLSKRIGNEALKTIHHRKLYWSKNTEKTIAVYRDAICGKKNEKVQRVVG